jgi:hypothetical protein
MKVQSENLETCALDLGIRHSKGRSFSITPWWQSWSTRSTEVYVRSTVYRQNRYGFTAGGTVRPSSWQRYFSVRTFDTMRVDEPTTTSLCFRTQRLQVYTALCVSIILKSIYIRKWYAKVKKKKDKLRMLYSRHISCKLILVSTDRWWGAREKKKKAPLQIIAICMHAHISSQRPKINSRPVCRPPAHVCRLSAREHAPVGNGNGRARTRPALAARLAALVHAARRSAAPRLGHARPATGHSSGPRPT